MAETINSKYLRNAVAKFEFGREVLDGLRGPTCETGEAYVEVASGGIKQEGESIPAFAASQEDAARLWLEAAERYASTRPQGVLHWRVRPEMGAMRVLVEGPQPDDRRVLFAVYSRFVIADVVEKSAAA